MKRQPKGILIIGLIVYSTMVVLSLVFYKERMTMLDDSLQLFSVLQRRSFAVANDRFGDMFSQSFPLLASYAGLSLKAVTMLYSVSFVLFHTICFLIILLYFKNTPLATCLLLFNTVFVAHSFYWVICELLHGVSFTLLFIASLEQQLKAGRLSKGFYIFLIPALITIVFFYPLLPIVVLFFFAFLTLHHGAHAKKPVVTVAIVYLVIWLMRQWLMPSDYDLASAERAQQALLTSHYWDNPQHSIFFKYILDDYFIIPFLLGIVVIGMIILKRYYKLALSLMAFTAVILLINITYNDGKAPQFYVEPSYSILTLFLAAPFCYDIIPAIHKPSISFAGLSMMMVLSLVKIYNTHHGYTARVDWMRRILTETQNLPKKKLILRESGVPLKVLKMSWAAATEFWLLSTIETGETRSVIIEERPHEFDLYPEKKHTFLTKWLTVPYNQLDKRYFKLDDTTEYVYYK